jgi:hypothetical protein
MHFRNRVCHAVTILLLPFCASAETGQRQDTDIKETRKWGAATADLALSILPDKRAYYPGERIILNLSLMNVGKSDLKTALYAPLGTYEITVFDEKGKPVPLTVDGARLVRTGKSGSMTMSRLRAGQQLAVDLPLNRIFDFSADGKYQISARKSGPPPSRDPVVTSNSVEITVDESLDPNPHLFEYQKIEPPASESTDRK